MIIRFASVFFLMFCLFALPANAIEKSDTLDSLIAEDSLYNPSSSFMNKVQQKSELKSIGFRAYVDSGLNSDDKFVRFSYRLIIVLFFVFIATFLFIIGNRFLVEYLKRKKSKINDKIEELIAIYISVDKDSKQELMEICDELNSMQKNKTARRIILKNILSVDLAFSGESNIQLRKLYTNLNYHKRAIQKLRSESWAKRAKAIRELAQMDIVETTEEIRFSLNHINPVLRLEAGIALLKLDKANPFSFLEVNRELTIWQQMNLLEIIRNHKSLKVPSFKPWLHSKQESIIEFSVKLISYYQQLDAIDDLRQLLKHASPIIRLEAVKCLGTLEMEDAIEDLFLVYELEKEESVRLQCIKSIAYLGGESSVVFLEKVLLSGNADEILIAAISLRESGVKGTALLETHLNTKDANLLKALKHALDENLISNR